MRRVTRHFGFLVWGACLVVSVVACGLGGAGRDNAQATADALGRSVVLTATAAVDEDSVSARDMLATAEVMATEVAATIEAAGTHGAGADASQATPSPVATLSPATEVAAATSDAQPPPGDGDTPPVPEAIAAELPAYEVDPASGSLGWIHPPLTLQAEGFQQFDLANDFGAMAVGDFVLAADITWSTVFGDAGCGFLLRSTSMEPESSQYLVVATRKDEGHVIFQTRQEGVFLPDELYDLDAGAIDPNFQWQNDTTNRLAVVGRGNTFTVYTNGTQLGSVTPLTRLDQGLVAFVALNDSGTTVCHFDNAWLWLPALP